MCKIRNMIKIVFLALIILLPFSQCAAQDSFLTLKEAYTIALENNEQVKISREQYEQAQKDVQIATSRLLPQVDTQVEQIRQKQFATFGRPLNPKDYRLYTVEVNQYVYQLGKLWSGRNLAEHFSQGSKFRHFRRRQEILFTVSGRYIDVLLGRRSIEIAQNALRRAQRQLERAKARFEVGVVTRTDVLRAQVQVARAREELERAKNQHDVALENLALEIGLDRVPGQVKKFPERSLPSYNLKELYQKAISKRKDLDQARQNLKAARERVAFEKADFFPRIELQGSYQRTNKPILFAGEDDTWQTSINLSYPLFTGGQNLAEVSQSKSRLRENESLVKRLKKEIRTQVRSVYLDIQTQKKVISQLQKQVETARRNYRQVTAQFEEGLATSVDQVDAFTALNEAENRLAQAYYTYQLDLIRLDLATGTFQEELLAKRSNKP